MQINLMQRAIDEAEKHKTPFGAVLFNGERIIAAANTSRKEGKIHHAEMNLFLKMDNAFKLENKPLELFTTCEPCPMCMGAAIWSGVDFIYYGVSISKAAEYLSQIHISSEDIAKKSFRDVKVVGVKMLEECISLFEKFN